MENEKIRREDWEKELLIKLEQGMFDGIAGTGIVIPEYEMWNRFVVWGGIPMRISFKSHTEPSPDTAIIERQYLSADEKIWFLRNHGWKMQHQEVVDYSRTYRKKSPEMMVQSTGKINLLFFTLCIK